MVPHARRRARRRLLGVPKTFDSIRKPSQRARAANVPIGLATVLRVIKPGEERDCSSRSPTPRPIMRIDPQPCRPELVHHTRPADAPRRRLRTERRQRNHRRLICGSGHGVIRMVPSYDRSWTEMSAMFSRISAGLLRNGGSPAHADVPHGALRLLPHALKRHELPRLRPPLRCPQGRTERSRWRGPSTGSRRRMSQHGVQRRRTIGGRVHPKNARELGISHFRVELLRETSAEVAPLLDRYAQVLSGKDLRWLRQTWRQLRVTQPTRNHPRNAE